MFAKLYGEGDDQVLFTKCEDDNSEPCICIETDLMDGAHIKTELVFESESERDQAFDETTESHAQDYRAEAHKEYEKLMSSTS